MDKDLAKLINGGRSFTIYSSDSSVRISKTSGLVRMERPHRCAISSRDVDGLSVEETKGRGALFLNWKRRDSPERTYLGQVDLALARKFVSEVNKLY